jgi:hypothetical protein
MSSILIKMYAIKCFIFYSPFALASQFLTNQRAVDVSRIKSCKE